MVQIVDVSHPEWWLARRPDEPNSEPRRVPSRYTFEAHLRSTGVWDAMLGYIQDANASKYPDIPPILCWQAVKKARGRNEAGAPLPPRPLVTKNIIMMIMNE